jgi:SAM-dependent methyltransferase
VWLGDSDLARVVDVVTRTLRPGGVFAFVDSSAESELRDRRFILTRLPVIDPVTRAAGTVRLAYAPGGAVAPFVKAEWILRLRRLRSWFPSLLHIGADYVRARAARHLPARAKRAIRRASALSRRGARLVRRVVKRS